MVDLMPPLTRPQRPQPIPGVSMPTDTLTRARLGFDQPGVEQRTAQGLGLSPAMPPLTQTKITPTARTVNPIMPPTTASSLNPQQQRRSDLDRQMQSYREQAFQKWHSTQKPEDLARFGGPGTLTGVVSPEQYMRVQQSGHGGDYTSSEATGSSVRLTANPSTASELAAVQREGARQHFLRNVIASDPEYARMMAERTAIMQPAMPPLTSANHNGLVPSRVVEGPKGTTTTYTQPPSTQTTPLQQSQIDLNAANAQRMRDENMRVLGGKVIDAAGKVVGNLVNGVVKWLNTPSKPDPANKPITPIERERLERQDYASYERDYEQRNQLYMTDKGPNPGPKLSRTEWKSAEEKKNQPVANKVPTPSMSQDFYQGRGNGPAETPSMTADFYQGRGNGPTTPPSMTGEFYQNRTPSAQPVPSMTSDFYQNRGSAPAPTSTPLPMGLADAGDGTFTHPSGAKYRKVNGGYQRIP